ncbi:protein SMG5 isoform X1 [Ixodes scapularis]
MFAFIALVAVSPNGSLLCRSASEAVRKLEEQLRNATSARARMAPEVTLLRTRVKEYCERLLFAAPLEYGRQAEELTWRKVYYEAVQQFKAPKRGVQGNGEGERVKDDEEEEAVLSLRAHLMSGLGHYHHLLIRLQAEYRLDLESSVDVPLRWSHRGLPRGRLSQRRQQPPHHGHDASGQHEESLVLWARQACHRLLLCLGDLDFQCMLVPCCHALIARARSKLTRGIIEGSKVVLEVGQQKGLSANLIMSASEAVRKLEEQLRNATSARARMAPEVTLLRTRVKEYCERLLFAAPLEYGRQAEELTWRKVYYEAVQQFKAPKRGVQGNGEGERVKDDEEEEAVLSLRAHLTSGLGHYHHLLIRLQAEYRLDLESSVDVPLRWSHRGLPRGRLSQRRQQPPHHGHDASGQHEESLVLWARQACHRLLLCLGDLARYLSELGAPGSGERERWALLSQRYYWQALGLDPEAGMPHNQLGTLAGCAHVGCNAAYHYLRCLQSGQPFDGAQGNLLRLLDKNSRLLLEAPHGGNNHLFHFSTHFLKLCEQLYTSTDTNGIQALCEETLAQLSALLAEPEMPTADLVFRAAVMAMLCTEKLRKSGPHPLSSAAAAFTLSLFSHVLAACSRRLAPPATDGHEDPVAPSSLRGPDAAQPDCVVDPDSCLDSGEGSGCGSPLCLVPPPGEKLKPETEQQSVQQSRPMKESHQRMTCSPSTSTDEGSTHESSDHSSPTDPWSSHPDSEEGESPLGTATNDSGGDPVRGSGRELLLQLGGEGLLPCIKVLCDWLRGHAEFMGPCAQAAGPLWLHLATLLNVLQRFEELVLATTDGRQAMDRCSDMGAPRGPVGLPGDNWGQGPPLAEDICLRGTVALARAHAAVDWALQPPSSQALQAWLRLECILQFGQWAANKPGSGLRYCPEERRFRPTAVSANGTVSPGPILGNILFCPYIESDPETARNDVTRADGRQAMDRCSDMGAPRGPVGLPGDNWGQGPPLAEDICLRGTVALARAHAAVDWALQPPSSQALQAWLRLECILQFGQWAANKPGSGLRYCPEERRFRPTAVSANGIVSPGPILGVY